MANSATLATLKTQALDYANMTLGFIDDTQLGNYINAGLGELHDILVNSYQEYLMTEQTITVVAGTESYDLATDFYKSLAMFYQSTSTLRTKIPRWNPVEQTGFITPTSAGTIKHWYIPQFTIVTGTIHLSVPVKWEDYVAIYAAQRCLMKAKLKDDAAMLMQERERMRKRMEDMATPRDVGENNAVVDVYNRFGTDAYVGRRGMYYAIVGNSVRLLESLSA